MSGKRKEARVCVCVCWCEQTEKKQNKKEGTSENKMYERDAIRDLECKACLRACVFSAHERKREKDKATNGYN